MDLLSHVLGVNITGSFTPGANTASPYNVAHTGGVDGTGPNNATKNMAEIYNRFLLDRAALIQKAGLSIDNANWIQMAEAVVKIAGGLDGGTCPVTGPAAAPTAGNPYIKYTSVAPYLENWEWTATTGWKVTSNHYESTVLNATSSVLAGGNNLVLTTALPRKGKIFVFGYSTIPAGTAATHTVLVQVSGGTTFTGTRSAAASGVEAISSIGITLNVDTDSRNLLLYAYPALAGAPSHTSYMKYQYID